MILYQRELHDLQCFIIYYWSDQIKEDEMKRPMHEWEDNVRIDLKPSEKYSTVCM